MNVLLVLHDTSFGKLVARDAVFRVPWTETKSNRHLRLVLTPMLLIKSMVL